MALTLNLTQELQTELRHEAAREGLDEAGYILRALNDRLRFAKSRTPRPEAELLSRINRGVTQEQWLQYQDLVEKRQAEDLTPEQHTALMALTHQIEEVHAQRFEALGELARLRGASLEGLMQELGIKFPENASIT